MFKSKKGFTLIELLVVIAIIGILASVVLASLNSARKKSRDARRVADIKQLQLALELEFDSARAYPAALATLATNGRIPVIPKDPLGADYVYELCGTTFYQLGTSLEEGTNPAIASSIIAKPSACATTWLYKTGTCVLGGTLQGTFCYAVTP